MTKIREREWKEMKNRKRKRQRRRRRICGIEKGEEE